MPPFRKTPRLSVVIPTKNRWPRLSECLHALSRQSLDNGAFEIIIIDDHSSDGSRQQLIDAQQSELGFDAFINPGAGPAAARNFGIQKARSDRIFLLGDDTIPTPSTLEKHLENTDQPIGIQGRIDWDPEAEITPVMRFLAPEGFQFWFRGLSDGDKIPFSGVYASNFSAPTRYLRAEPFDEHFLYACMEDTEAAWRWHMRGLSFRYSADATCLHRHHYDRIEAFLQRRRLAGAEAKYCVRRHSGMASCLLYRPLFLLIRRLLFPVRTPEDAWERAARLEYFCGWFEGPERS